MRDNAWSAWVRQVCDCHAGSSVEGAVQSTWRRRAGRRKEGAAQGDAAPWSSWLEDVSVLLFLCVSLAGFFVCTLRCSCA